MILVIVGIAAGLLVSDAVMNGLSAGAVGIVVATVVIWIIHGVLAIWVAAPVLLHRNSKILAWLIDLAAIAVSLIVANVALKDLTIAGANTYAFATLIIFTTSNIAAFATEIGDQKQA